MSNGTEVQAAELTVAGRSAFEMLVEVVVVPLGLTVAGFVVYDLLAGLTWLVRELPF